MCVNAGWRGKMWIIHYQHYQLPYWEEIRCVLCVKNNVTLLFIKKNYMYIISSRLGSDCVNEAVSYSHQFCMQTKHASPAMQ